VTGLLLYDADCGFCTRVAALAPKMHLATDVRPQQSVDLAAVGVSPERAPLEVPFVAADGSVVYGHEAIAGALRTGPLPARWLGALMIWQPVSHLAREIYRLVARYRHRLPGSTSACRIPE
jgi:predicted DCC family thiol-disulfide oxidoreductase YuxK